ncbi:hypothetical protein [Planotetraspora kaengkrachanensis]|uniref:hypothetical protein n=1 Tax=Planotetraspora kaengkrachanensis TaxID=575193 RepID=UPI00194275EB|nr:hypothetical protein [Planotetraspora kaengkrachanensis]
MRAPARRQVRAAGSSSRYGGGRYGGGRYGGGRYGGGRYGGGRYGVIVVRWLSSPHRRARSSAPTSCAG